MFPHSPQSAVPPDKLVQQLIVQAIQAFYIQDYETGIYFLQQIKSNLPRYMYQLNPQMRSLAKEVVKLLQDGSLVPDRSADTVEEAAADTHPGLSGSSPEYTPQIEAPQLTETEIEGPTVDTSQDVVFEPQTESVGEPAEEFPTAQQTETQITKPPYEETEAPRGTLPSDFISELSTAVNSVRDKKKKKKKDEKLVGSMDELEDFDF